MYPTFILYLSIIIILYHSYKIYLKLNDKMNPWVNIIHVLLIGPILFYIGKNKELTPNYMYEIMLLLGFSAIGYNSYKLYNLY